MTVQPGCNAAAAADWLLIRLTRSVPALTAVCLAAADWIFAVAVAVAGLMAWSPRIGIEAARSAFRARRERRSRLHAIGQNQGIVWVRHARRTAPPAYADRVLARCISPPANRR